MFKTLDKQLEARPKKVIFCKRCAVSNQRPRTDFDEEGICSACRFAEEKDFKIDWKKRETELLELLDRHRSKDGSFDVIIPSSGGKDSSYVAHQLKYRYGMHPLTVTWAPFIYTDIGWKNYVSLINAGFSNNLFYPNGKIHRKLARIAFEYKGDHWEPFTFGQKAYGFHMAVKYNIPLIFFGENGEAEYGGSTKSKDKPYESVTDWEKFHFKGSGVDALVQIGLEAGLIKPGEMQEKSLEMYKAPPLDLIDRLGLQMHWYSYYQKWVPQENFYYAVTHTGFEVNPERSEGTYSKYSSLDDKTDGFHWYLGYIKFGLGRASREAQMEIRAKHLTREEGVALVKKYDGEFPIKYYKDFIDYLGISDEQFWKVVDRYRELSPHLWDRSNGDWKLKHTVWEDAC